MSVSSNPVPDLASRPSLWRPLLPREHGAYGELAFPLVTALSLGRPTRGAIALSLSGVALFLAHESVLVVLGQRGRRALDTDGARARLWLVLLGTTAAIAGVLGLSSMPAGAVGAVFPPLFLAGVVIALVIAKREKTLVGEVLAAAALTAPAYPVAIAAGAGGHRAAMVAGLWTGCFTLSVLAVRGLIAARKTNADRTVARVSAALSVLSLAASIALAIAHRIPSVVYAAVAPFAVLSLWLYTAPPHPRYLRAIGWGLIAASVLSCVVIAVGLR
jgi:hypothetical protein